MKTIALFLGMASLCRSQPDAYFAMRHEFMKSVELDVNELVWSEKWCRNHGGRDDYATMRNGARVSCVGLPAYTSGVLEIVAATLQIISSGDPTFANYLLERPSGGNQDERHCCHSLQVHYGIRKNASRRKGGCC